MNGYYLIMYCTFKLQREVDLSCPKVSAIVYYYIYYDLTLINSVSLLVCGTGVYD